MNLHQQLIFIYIRDIATQAFHGYKNLFKKTYPAKIREQVDFNVHVIHSCRKLKRFKIFSVKKSDLYFDCVFIYSFLKF